MDKKVLLQYLVVYLLVNFMALGARGQIDNDGCVKAKFGIDAGLYSGTIEYGNGIEPAGGSTDWFLGTSGIGVIDESQKVAIQGLLMGPSNPTYFVHMKYAHSQIVNSQLMIDGLFARDHFGGTGWIDSTSFNTASKNGEDPAIWDPGPQNVLGKNDLIDVSAMMLRDGTTMDDDLYFAGIITRAEPGGDAYMDFEFFVREITYDKNTGFNSGGPQLGHTAFDFHPTTGAITTVGDFIFNVSLTGGGTTPDVEVRLWVSYADWLADLHPPGFTWSGTYDGAYTGSPYGYAGITPTLPEICGIVNQAGQTTTAPPWGTKITKYNNYQTTYAEYSVVELMLNMTAFGIDHSSLLGYNECDFPIHTVMVKTRASNSFTAQLKDFAGPFDWGQPRIDARIIGGSLLSCANPTVDLIADPIRSDVTYLWTTPDGVIDTDPTLETITVSAPGSYILVETLSTGCPTIPDTAFVILDPTKPLFETPTTTVTVSCTGNSGAVNLTIVGGTPPLTYAWTNGAVTEDISGLAPGTYQVTITDNIGCEVVSAEAIVPAKTPVSITPTIVDNVCYGYTAGSITLGSITGHSPFTFAWSNGNTSQNISNLGAGTYGLTVTDADGCTHTFSYVVAQPTAVTATGVAVNDTDPSPGINNGSITLSPTGGTPGYTYIWSNGATTQNLTGLAYGSYSVTVTDSEECKGTANFFIYEPEICNDLIDNDGDGYNNCLDSDCTPATPGTITPGDATPCTGEAITYTVPVNASYDSYQWTVPGNATINSGQGSNTISVTWSSVTPGQICVRGQIFDCLSNPSCITVTPHTVPVQPQPIIKN